MTDLVEIPKEHLLLEQVQTLVLLESKGCSDILEVPAEQLEVLEVAQDNTLLEAVPELVLLTEARQGPPGPPGIPGPAGGQVLQREAGMDMSALVVVYEDLFGSVWPAEPDRESHVLALLGVTVSAAVAGQPINVQRLGHIDDEAWQLQPGKRVFLGGQGRLTQEPPQAGYDVLIGTAITSTRLLLNIQDPIELE